jgi:hypothetical protein
MYCAKFSFRTKVMVCKLGHVYCKTNGNLDRAGDNKEGIAIYKEENRTQHNTTQNNIGVVK